MGGGGKGGGGNSEAKRARKEEAARQARVRAGTKRIGDIFDSNFNDTFFANRRKSFMDYATPQLQDQHGKANKELTYSLARSHLLDSSARGDLASQLQKEYEIANQNIKDQALGYESDARSKIEDARANLVSMVNVTGDVQGAVQGATARAAALSQPTPYSPLANLFADFTDTIGQQYARDRAAAMGGAVKTGGVNLFGAGRKAVVTR